ncbi:hypothetical protein BDR26DRAFT_870407 [Obelidium mucronatum]|nr:hypothetical protein BDR26DRAFT_870407 [Obelidium mucronatum]
MANKKCTREETGCTRCLQKSMPCIYSMNSTRNKAYRALKKENSRKPPTAAKAKTALLQKPAISVRNPTPPLSTKAKKGRRHSAALSVQTATSSSSSQLEPAANVVRSNSSPPLQQQSLGQETQLTDPIMQWLMSPVQANTPLPQSPLPPTDVAMTSLLCPTPAVLQHQQRPQVPIYCDDLFKPSSLYSVPTWYHVQQQQHQQVQYVPRTNSHCTFRQSRTYSDSSTKGSPYALKHPKRQVSYNGNDHQDLLLEVGGAGDATGGNSSVLAGPIGVSFTAADLNQSVDSVLAGCKISGDDDFMAFFQ